MSLTYLHNPKCSKSRQGLEILNQKKVSFQVREYLKDPLNGEELLSLFSQLELGPEKAVRKKEALYQELKLSDKELSPEKWSQIIAKYPILLERPILFDGKKAVIGRPSENLQTLL